MDMVNWEHPAAGDVRGVKLDWHIMDSDQEFVTVPPRASGLVRLIWDGKKEKEGAERLSVALWTQVIADRAAPRDYPPSLEFPFFFAPAIRVLPGEVTIDDLGPYDQKSGTFDCWSSTRAQFDFGAREESGDPCFRVESRIMDQAERAALSVTARTRVLCGYRVKVTVRERSDDQHQLDLGPYSRHLLLDVDGGQLKSSIAIRGVVRGDVRVGAEEDRGKINLGTFPARSGAQKTVTIQGDQPDMVLRLNDIQILPENVEILKVRLEDLPVVGGKPRWKLHVQIRPGVPPGKLPEHLSLLLRLRANPPRQVRVPILGEAYQ
jgi:hypothetical protein